jgi:3-hydroxyacyl-[acyl-carrier-protein] dehydratase
MLDHAAIRDILPQRFPMLLLDRVVVEEPGVAVTGYKAVTAAEPCYRDLPDRLPAAAYAYPVSLLLESFGQAAAVLWLHTGGSPPRDADAVLMLGALRDCRIEGAVYPGDVLRHEVRLEHATPGAAFARGETWIGDRRVATMGTFVAVTRSRHAVVDEPP